MKGMAYAAQRTNVKAPTRLLLYRDQINNDMLEKINTDIHIGKNTSKWNKTTENIPMPRNIKNEVPFMAAICCV